jgi:hypothetical protein
MIIACQVAMQFYFMFSNGDCELQKYIQVELNGVYYDQRKLMTDHKENKS